MRSSYKKAFQFIIFFGIGIGLMWWQFSQLKPDDRAVFFFALTHANYFWFALAIFVGALAHLSRAIRWQQLLHPLGHKIGLGSRFYAVMIGYLANYGLPRSGEVIRCGVLKTSDDLPFSESFGTVVVERIVDTICLALVFVTVLIVEFSDLKDLWIAKIWDPACEKFNTLMGNHTLMIIIIVCVVLFFGSLFIFRKKIKKFFSEKLGKFAKGFKSGILAIKKVPSPGWFIFHSLFIWSCYLLSLYLCFFCFPNTQGLSLNIALILLLFGTFGVIFTPGGIGAYQVIIAGVLIFLFKNIYNQTVDLKDVAPYAWLSWGSQVFTVIIFFGISLAIKPLLNRLSK
jgi:uncharacterized protein (TIRG00374 family)